MIKTIEEFLMTLEQVKDLLENINRSGQSILPLQDKMFNTSEAAEFLGVSDRTLYSYRKQGLKYSQIGRKILFQQKDLVMFINEYRS